MSLSLSYFEIWAANGLIAVFWGVLLQAWHDRSVIRKDQKWHSRSFIMNIVIVSYSVLMTIVIPEWEFQSDFSMWAWIISMIAFDGFLMWNIFDPYLNKLRGLSWDHRGKNILDQIPFWMKMLCLALSIVALIMIKVFLT